MPSPPENAEHMTSCLEDHLSKEALARVVHVSSDAPSRF